MDPYDRYTSMTSSDILTPVCIIRKSFSIFQLFQNEFSNEKMFSTGREDN